MEVGKIYQHKGGNVVLAVSKGLIPIQEDDVMVVMKFKTIPPIIWNRQKLIFYTERKNGWLPDGVFPLWDYEWKDYKEVGVFKNGKANYHSQEIKY